MSNPYNPPSCISHLWVPGTNSYKRINWVSGKVKNKDAITPMRNVHGKCLKEIFT